VFEKMAKLQGGVSEVIPKMKLKRSPQIVVVLLEKKISLHLPKQRHFGKVRD
jgi:hypothetical protein